MRAYLELIRTDLLLALRNKSVLFFNYLFPLIFFFAFAEFLEADRGAGIIYVVNMVLLLGILGNGLFGAGMRTVQERETNILRRFKVAPISATPILVASLLTGLVLYLPALLLVLSLAHFLYGMSLPQHLASLTFLVSLGVVAFRALGLILASAANSMQEVNILVQLFYSPLLFLSGALFPLTLLPFWLQVAAQYLPATYLAVGLQGILLRGESLLDNWAAVLSLLVTVLLSLFISVQIFRWEKDEKVSFRAKLWILAVLAPFLLMGAYQTYSRGQIEKSRALYRELQRRETTLIRNTKIFVGNGEVIESGSVLIKDGRIERLYSTPVEYESKLKANIVEGSGKTLLPGLIDLHVHLSSSGETYDQSEDLEPPTSPASMRRALASYLYCGITAVRSVGDPLPLAAPLKIAVNEGQVLGAELFASGPILRAKLEKESPTFGGAHEGYRQVASGLVESTPETIEDAVRTVTALGASGAGIVQVWLGDRKLPAVVEKFRRSILSAIAAEARRQRLPVLAWTVDGEALQNALLAGVQGIEQGSTDSPIPDATLIQMERQGLFYLPILSPMQAQLDLAARDASQLESSLMQQVLPPQQLARIRRAVAQGRFQTLVRQPEEIERTLGVAQANLARAQEAGVRLAAGSGAGHPYVIHGPTLQRELQMWVEAGIRAPDALQAATGNAARVLEAEKRIGLIKPGFEATLLLVDGDPLTDITALQRVSQVFFKGERINRSGLLEQE